jgi:hypothetical protein
MKESTESRMISKDILLRQSAARYWDAPNHRGSWADQGVPGVYLGPALDHLRSLEVWVPNTSAPRITNTVWWFLADHTPDPTLTDPDPTLTYPPTKTRPHPLADGTGLIGRTFFEPELGVCLIVGTGRVTQHRMVSRAALARQRESHAPPIQIGSHHTLTYKQLTSDVRGRALTSPLSQRSCIGLIAVLFCFPLPKPFPET